MNPSRTAILSSMAAVTLLMLPDCASASEGALGRPITGLQVTSYAGVVPPTPGFSTMFGHVRYDGAIDASREVPIAGTASLGLDAQVEMFTATGIYIWDTAPGRWNYASMATLGHIDVQVNALVGVGPAAVRRADSTSGLYDLLFAPVIASYHISETQHLSLALNVFAPIGDYEAGELANAGLNVWTTSPSIGYTQLMQGGTLELSALAAVDFYSRNGDTDYQNGAVMRVDALMVKRFENGFGVGVVAGVIHQLQDDEGNLPDRLDGFKGRSLALGPVVNYLKRWEGGQMELSLRWLNEFSVENRFRGEPLMFSASLAL